MTDSGGRSGAAAAGTAVAVVLVGVAGCATSPAGSPSLLRACAVPGVEETVHCGTLEVFEDRDAGAGRRIPLNIVVLPARSPEPLADPVFVLAGGPGQAATSLAPGLVNAWYRERRDVVLVDQRGTGRSNGLHCPAPGGSRDPQGYLADVFGDPAEFRRCRRDLERRADLRFYTTTLAMADLDDVRAALGYERINLTGASYGTRAALVYIRHFPDRVRSAILNGVSPIALRNPLYHARDARRAAEALIDECARDTACGSAFPGLDGEYRAVLDRLDREPASVRIQRPGGVDGITVTLSRPAFAEALRVMMYDGRRTRLVPLLIHRAHAGELGPFAQLAVEANQGIRSVLAFGMLLSVVCPEDIARIDPEEVPGLTAGTGLGDGRVRQQMRVCEEWPAVDAGAGFGAPVTADVPVLLMSGTLDPVTPASWGEEAARHLARSVHIVAPGGHGVRGPCINSIERQFLSQADVSRLDTSCVRDMSLGPFDLPPDT
jgi:pimeloyl-ACP methyl ester carboxylesterase